jgi:hypothetical protein
MYTIDKLMNIALEAEKEYLELRKNFPPGTYNKQRNDAFQLNHDALICAAWMEKEGIIEIENIGPFTSTLSKMLDKNDRVKIKKGSIVHSTHPSIPREGIVTSKVQTVTIRSIDKGYIQDETVKNGTVHWAGTGGYWKWCSINDVSIK